ncbi:hypothetical protein K3495_g11811 [Podosphaera aphanis]|nr:hypothetical protein K3495_g11811 [Podosphaera aphanis]
MFGGAVEWKATKQKTVTTSSTEAELLALSSIGSLSYWCDNMQSVRIANAESDSVYTKLRHFDIHQSWIRQETKKGDIIVKWNPTSEQQADGFKKLLPRQLY